jgi:hypothetical protein
MSDLVLSPKEKLQHHFSTLDVGQIGHVGKPPLPSTRVLLANSRNLRSNIISATNSTRNSSLKLDTLGGNESGKKIVGGYFSSFTSA